MGVLTDNLDVDVAEDMMKTMIEDTEWYAFMKFIRVEDTTVSSDPNSGVQIMGASDKAFQMMHDAYETMSKVVREARTCARQLSQQPDPTGVIENVIQAASEHSRIVQEGLDKLDVLLTTPKKAITYNIQNV